MFQDPSGIIDHILDDLLGGEDFAYLSGDATGKPWPRLERILGVFLEVVFYGDDALFEEGFGFGLTVVLPDEGRCSKSDHHYFQNFTTHQSSIYGLLTTRRGLPVYIRVLAKSSWPESTIAFLCIGGAPASSQATNLVPTHTA